MICNRCSKMIGDNEYFLEVHVTALSSNRPLPLVFVYCSHQCHVCDTLIYKKFNAVDSYNNYKWENPDD